MDLLIKRVIGINMYRKIKSQVSRWITFHLTYKAQISKRFEIVGKSMNWESPKTLDEKIQYLKFYSDTTMWTRLSDKFLVRDYICKKGLSNLLVPILGKWDRASDIDWDKLPDQFIMKVNHMSGDALICNNKQVLDTKKWTSYFESLLNMRYGLDNIEPHYSSIRPCIIAEKLLDASKQYIRSSSLVDFKVWCIHGIAQYIWVCYDRIPDSVQVMMYDRTWTPLPEMCVNTKHYRIADQIIDPPNSLSKMINAAENLAKGIPQVRVDFYEVDGSLYFGELTFTSCGGFNTQYSQKFQEELGSRIDLTKVLHK